RHDHIGQRQLLDRAAVKRAVLGQAGGQFAPDHSGSAGDENVHGFPERRPSCPHVLRASTSFYVATIKTWMAGTSLYPAITRQRRSAASTAPCRRRRDGSGR